MSLSSIHSHETSDSQKPIKLRTADSSHVPFLLRSKYCDYDHDLIQGLSNELSMSSSNDRELAVKTFYWVRDQIIYNVGQISESSSETLRQKRGTCSNKANLLVALLRANGIPAAFRTMRVKTKEYFGPAITARFRKFLSHESFHVFAAVNIEGVWLGVDPSDDYELSINSHHFNPQSKPVEFDGTKNALLNLDPTTILQVNEANLPHIDEILEKQPRIPPTLLQVFNMCMNFGRMNGRDYQDPEKLTGDFFVSLAKQHPNEYAFFCAAERALEANSALKKKTAADQIERSI